MQQIARGTGPMRFCWFTAEYRIASMSMGFAIFNVRNGGFDTDHASNPLARFAPAAILGLGSIRIADRLRDLPGIWLYERARSLRNRQCISALDAGDADYHGGCGGDGIFRAPRSEPVAFLSAFAAGLLLGAGWGLSGICPGPAPLLLAGHPLEDPPELRGHRHPGAGLALYTPFILCLRRINAVRIQNSSSAGAAPKCARWYGSRVASRRASIRVTHGHQAERYDARHRPDPAKRGGSLPHSASRLCRSSPAVQSRLSRRARISRRGSHSRRRASTARPGKRWWPTTRCRPCTAGSATTLARIPAIAARSMPRSSIHAVERFLGDLAAQQNWTHRIEAKPSGKRVLIVGAGPSGLSAGYHLSAPGPRGRDPRSGAACRAA